MARPDRDASRYQTEFLTNRGVADAFDTYDELAREDTTLTRCRYTLLVILFAVNLSISVALLVLAVVSQPEPSEVQWKTVSTMVASDPREWLACRRYVTDSERIRHDCAVIDDQFCHAASEVIIWSSSPRPTF